MVKFEDIKAGDKVKVVVPNDLSVLNIPGYFHQAFAQSGILNKEYKAVEVSKHVCEFSCLENGKCTVGTNCLVEIDCLDIEYSILFGGDKNHVLSGIFIEKL